MRGKLKTWPLSLHGPETEKVSPFPFSQSVYLLVMCIGQHGHSLGCRVGAALEVGGGHCRDRGTASVGTTPTSTKASAGPETKAAPSARVCVSHALGGRAG